MPACLPASVNEHPSATAKSARALFTVLTPSTSDVAFWESSSRSCGVSWRNGLFCGNPMVTCLLAAPVSLSVALLSLSEQYACKTGERGDRFKAWREPSMSRMQKDPLRELTQQE